MPNIEISEETLTKIKEQFPCEIEIVDVNKLEDLVGQKVFFRTVTYHILGEVESIIGNVIKLKTASWIADSGRFADFIKNGISDSAEVEPLGSWFVNFNAVVDFGIWKHKLPTKQQ